MIFRLTGRGSPSEESATTGEHNIVFRTKHCVQTYGDTWYLGPSWVLIIIPPPPHTRCLDNPTQFVFKCYNSAVTVVTLDSLRAKPMVDGGWFVGLHAQPVSKPVFYGGYQKRAWH